MFAYCLNNPVCMADYNGCDAIYVIDYEENRGLPVVGHSIVFLQDTDGVWHKTQYAGVFPDKSTATIELYTADMTEIESMINGDEIENIEYLYISGDFSNSLAYAEKHSGTNYGGYDLLKNNCFHYARDTLLEGTFDDVVDYAALTRYTGNIPAQSYDYLVNSRKLAAVMNEIRGALEDAWNAITSWF